MAKKATPLYEWHDANIRVITVLASQNPKRGKSAERFALYKDGMTVAEYCAAGGRLADVRWDVEHGYIAISAAVRFKPNLMSGKLVAMAADTPIVCDPSSETYWSM